MWPGVLHDDIYPAKSNMKYTVLMLVTEPTAHCKQGTKVHFNNVEKEHYWGAQL